ncbi:hypothetical protein NC652_000430 [Populus alba x Populus x berolinensis]|nr:hypothetical protein NC652_000430 [Populus alba x Populus x berolinensis]
MDLYACCLLNSAMEADFIDAVVDGFGSALYPSGHENGQLPRKIATAIKEFQQLTSHKDREAMIVDRDGFYWLTWNHHVIKPR